jgi:hypothetical protein
MTAGWSAEELERIGAAQELRISTSRADGTLRREVPIWVVRVSGHVYVRTWYRRDSGWFGHAVDWRRARIRVPGLQAGVAIEDIGDDKTELRAEVDLAYRAKYSRYGEPSVAQMVTDAAAATTLQLFPGPGAVADSARRPRPDGPGADPADKADIRQAQAEPDLPTGGEASAGDR